MIGIVHFKNRHVLKKYTNVMFSSKTFKGFVFLGVVFLISALWSLLNSEKSSAAHPCVLSVTADAREQTVMDMDKRTE